MENINQSEHVRLRKNYLFAKKKVTFCLHLTLLQITLFLNKAKQKNVRMRPTQCKSEKDSF